MVVRAGPLRRTGGISVGARRVGISCDTVAKNDRFASQRAVDYPLLSDSTAAVAAEFGVRRGALTALGAKLVRRQEIIHGRHSRRRLLARVLMSPQRTTFVLDTDRTVLTVISSELRASIHADLALSFLRTHRPRPAIAPARRQQGRVQVRLGALRGPSS